MTSPAAFQDEGGAVELAPELLHSGAKSPRRAASLNAETAAARRFNNKDKQPMKRTLSLLIFALYLFAPLAARADAGPTIWKSSLRVYTTRFETYWPTPTAKEPQYLTTSWMPRFTFTVQGPLAGGSKITVSFTKPDGSAWLSLPCDTPEIGPEDTARIESPNEQTNDKRAIRTTGNFGFTIKLTNELTQTKTILYTGTFTVSNFILAARN